MVSTKVINVGEGDIVGKAVALKPFKPKRGLYVLVARPEDTIPPTGAGIDELNVYGGVVYVGVDKTKLGNVVAIVADSDDRKDAMAEGVSVEFVPLLREYKPIMGDSLLLIPKLWGGN